MNLEDFLWDSLGCRTMERGRMKSTHSFTCSVLLASLARFAALFHSLVRLLSRTRDHGKENYVYELNESMVSVKKATHCTAPHRATATHHRSAPRHRTALSHRATASRQRIVPRHHTALRHFAADVWSNWLRHRFSFERKILNLRLKERLCVN